MNHIPSRVFWSALLFALVFPSALTLAYFVLLARWPAGVQQAVYTTGKLVQFTFPVVFLWAANRWEFSRRPATGTAPQRSWWHRPWSTRGMGFGIGFGLLVMLAMLLLYHQWLAPQGHLSGLAAQVSRKVAELGIDSVMKYVALGVFYALIHSLLEEYYWRWFVFGRLHPVLGLWPAIGLSSVGFMAHHVILLGTFFGWLAPATYLFSMAVAAGGAVWAWLFGWSRSLLGPWLSHLLIDAAIFLIGFDLVRSQLSP